MNTTRAQVKEKIHTYLRNVDSGKSGLMTEGAWKAVEERMRRDQVDLIVVQLDDEAINDVRNPTLKRALKTLKQICG